MNFTALVSYGFAAAVTFSCVRHLAKGGLKQDFAVFAGRSRREWVEVALGDLFVVGLLVAICFAAINGPTWLQFSWLNLLAKKGQGQNMMLAGAQIPVFGIAFLVILILNLPRLAASEEEEFRYGTKDWLHAIPRSLTFGLMHMIVGVPLWCGLALAVPGMWFTAQYFKGGVSRSTMAHALYNFMLVGVLFAYVLNLNVAAFAVHR